VPLLCGLLNCRRQPSELRLLRQWRSSLGVVFVETPIFTKRVGNYFNDDEYSQLQSFLSSHPEAGKVIPGSGGIRKLRWAARGRGKRGGLRILYFWWLSSDRISMLIIYAKNETGDLTPAQIARLKKELAV
jgi:hypothetical protein